ncbi:TetR family transcriptional regulator [Pectinatus cerevisiiphilus]|uniref:TetR family transcriptional regulator n=2 Tax=Pectinatus cerevisiiphilus TaxID=86956 RepID=A0A4R3KBJ2_9FIRM|nr:TetR family transcriptional regulator [Pectinatus cerevisiiphilus]
MGNIARTKDPQARMNEILEAAEQLFAVQGYYSTTIRDISQKIGVAQGMLYYYFKSKEDVLETLLDKHVNVLLFEASTIQTTVQAPSEKIASLLSMVLQKAMYKNGLLLNMIYDVQNLQVKQKLFLRIEEGLSPKLTAIIEDGIKQKQFSVSYIPTAIDYILTILEFLSLALYQRTSPRILTSRIRMAEKLIESTLSSKDKSIHIYTNANR